jgi:hypothetical protein
VSPHASTGSPEAGRHASVMLTEQALAVLSAARAAAAKRHDWLVTDLDVLGALLDVEPEIRSILPLADVDVDAFRKRILEHCRLQPQLPATSGVSNAVELSKPVRRLLHVASEAAGRAGASAIAPMDILEAMAAGKAPASLLLREAGATASAIRGARPSRPPNNPLEPGEPSKPQATAPSRPPSARPAASTQALTPSLPRPTTLPSRPLFLVRIGGMVLLALAKGLRYLLVWQNTALAVGVFAPGAAALVGLRVYVARLAKIPYHASIRRWPGDVNLETENGTPLGGVVGRVVVRLLPHAILFVLGTVLVTPLLVDFGALSVSPIPALTSDPSAALNDDVIVTAGLSALLANGLVDLVRLWVGIALWFWATPSYELVRASRVDLASLAEGKVATARASLLIARFVRATLALPQALLWVLRPVDEIAMWAGGNVVIGTAGFGLAVSLILEITVLSYWFA